MDTAFSLGFARAFGHPGAGGWLAFADPDSGAALAYVKNRLGFHLTGDPPEKALRDTIYRCLDAHRAA